MTNTTEDALGVRLVFEASPSALKRRCGSGTGSRWPHLSFCGSPPQAEGSKGIPASQTGPVSGTRK